MLKGFLIRNLDIVYLIYGLAFFILGFSVLLRKRKPSAFELSNIIWLVGAFGILHGINEWLDMLNVYHKYKSYAWTVLTTSILTASYIFLFEFGRRLTKFTHPKFINFTGTIIVSALSVFLSFQLKFSPGIWPRYLLGFSGCMLTAYGLTEYYRHNRTILKLLKYKKYIIITIITVTLYGILSGLVTPKAYFFPARLINKDSFLRLIGIPVEVFRGICALILAIIINKLLNFFEWEVNCELKTRIQETSAAKLYVDNILKSMIDLLIVVSPDKKIKSLNEAACEISGYKKEELFEKPLESLIGNKPFLSQKESRQLSEKGFLISVEKILLNKNNQQIPIMFTISLIKNQDNEITGILLLGKDVSENKKMEQKLIQAQKLTALGKISSIICHDIKNQLSVLRNSIYFLKLKITDKNGKIRDHLNMLENVSIETNQIIDNIREFSKTNSPQQKEESIPELISSCLKEINLPENIKIDLKMPEKLPLLYVDKTQISRVFFNIINNAIQAMEKGGILIIEVFKTTDLVEFLFKDTGIGIKDENKENLFELFFSTKEKGMGIGLATAKIIAEAHGGSIDLQSQYQKGTTVTIKLPYRKDRDE